MGEEEQLEGEFGRGGHGRGREMVSSYPAANFFFLPFFPPAATLILIPLRLQGPVPPPGTPSPQASRVLAGVKPGVEGTRTGAQTDPHLSILHDSPTSSTSIPDSSQQAAIDIELDAASGGETSVLAPTYCPPLLLPAKKKR